MAKSRSFTSISLTRFAITLASSFLKYNTILSMFSILVIRNIHRMHHTKSILTYYLFSKLHSKSHYILCSGVEFRWSWGTAILALEKFELMRAPQQFQCLLRGAKANLKILKGHHGKLCIYSHLTSYIFLKLKDEREGAGLACPSFGNCIELFSLVKTLLTIDKTTH